MQRVPRKLISLGEHFHGNQMKDKPLKIQPVYKNDAVAWRWLSERDYPLENDSELRKLATQLKSSKKATQQLSIECKAWATISDSVLFYFSHSLKALPGLKTFRFSFNRCLEITDKGFDDLFKRIRGLSSLENLSLSFVSLRRKITDQGVQKLGNSIKRLSGLKSLGLEFEDCYGISDMGLKSLGHSLKNLRKLKSLSLYFTQCFDMTDSGIQNLGKTLKGLSLKSLSLKFYNGHMTDVGLKSVQETLGKFVLLRKVHLRFNGNPEISNIALKQIMDSLKTLVLLKDIGLFFGFCKGITDSDLESVVKTLKSLKSLEAVSLDFSHSEVTDEGLFYLREVSKKNLKTFEAKFRRCSWITDSGLEYLCLKKFVSLQTLSLSFWDCQGITDIRLSSFSKELGKLVGLRNLKLSFGLSWTITEKGLIYLCGAFQKFVLLQNFELDFQGCQEITRLVGLKLCEVLQIIGCSLKSIRLIFGDYDLFSDVELKLFYGILKNNCCLLEKIHVRSNKYIDLCGKRNIRDTICFLESELVEGRGAVQYQERERNEEEGDGGGKKRKRNGINRLFGCFRKKLSGKQINSSRIGMNNQL